MGRSNVHMNLRQNIFKEMEEKNSLWKRYLETKDPKSITIITECEIRFEEAQEKLSEIRRRILYHMLNIMVKWSGTTLREKRSWDQGYWIYLLMEKQM